MCGHRPAQVAADVDQRLRRAGALGEGDVVSEGDGGGSGAAERREAKPAEEARADAEFNQPLGEVGLEDLGGQVWSHERGELSGDDVSES